MAKNPKRNFIRLDDHIWSHDGIRSLSDSAALAYVYMIAWSNANKLDGVVTKIGTTHTDAGPEELAELEAAGFIEPHERGWRVVKWTEWQLTNADCATYAAAGAVNGVKGGLAKKAAQVSAEASEPSAAAIPGDPREEWLTMAFQEWPRPGSGYYAEKPANFRPPFMSSVVTEQDWEDFRAALNARLARYEREEVPREQKRKMLGSFKNFCYTWREELVPTSTSLERPAAPPAAPAKPKAAAKAREV